MNCRTIIFESSFNSIPSFFIFRTEWLKNSSSKAGIMAFNHIPTSRYYLKMGRRKHHPSFIHSSTHPNCIFTLPTYLRVHIHSTKYCQMQLPAEEVAAQRGDSVAPVLWHFYSSDWDFQKGNELSKSDYNSVWIGLLTSWVIYFKTLVTKAFAFFFSFPIAFTFFITQVWSNIVLWQAVRAKLKHCFLLSSLSFSCSFPFLMTFSRGLLITKGETDLFHL